MRIFAIGDIHGCKSALDHLLNFVPIKPGDQIITLGDYIDRGLDSKGVIDRLIALHVAGQLVPLRGNHELMMLGAKEGGFREIRFWLECGGAETLMSYGHEATLDDVPETHWHFLKHSCLDYYEIDTHFFVHANVHPGLPLDQQVRAFVHWEFLDAEKHMQHCSGKVMVCGHSEQKSGKPLNLGTAVCIDTGAYDGKWLTCLDVESGEYWQANEWGDSQRGSLQK